MTEIGSLNSPPSSCNRGSLDSESIGSGSDHQSGLCNRGWYHGPISRTAAVDQVSKIGDFLVRDCISSPGNFVLTCRNAENKVLHFRLNKLIEQEEDGTLRAYFQFEDDCFDTVTGLIEHYVASSIPVSANSKAVLIRGVDKANEDPYVKLKQCRSRSQSSMSGASSILSL